MEGPDGSGKTTVLKALLPLLEEKLQQKVVATREPGGSVIAEKIRHVILDVEHTQMDYRTEALLYAAARRQHLVETVLPNLEQGNILLCDRFVDSSLVYQGVARGIGVDAVAELNRFATDGVKPDVTIYLDVSAEVGLERIAKARGNRQFDRLDQEGIEFHRMVRQAYLEIIEKEKERFIVIDATKSVDEVVEECLTALLKKLS